MGETRVDLLHLLEDLRDAYPGGLEETILTEIVANSLDSGASLVAFAADPAAATLTVVDDGAGMKRRELARFHDIAATTKTRGEGIGFAGVGIKLGLLACEEVVTETRRGATHVASAWSLASRHRAPWKWVPPPGMVGEHGTAVRLTLREPLAIGSMLPTPWLIVPDVLAKVAIGATLPIVTNPVYSVSPLSLSVAPLSPEAPGAAALKLSRVRVETS